MWRANFSYHADGQTKVHQSVIVSVITNIPIPSQWRTLRLDEILWEENIITLQAIIDIETYPCGFSRLVKFKRYSGGRRD
jgi:hypothetical protein